MTTINRATPWTFVQEVQSLAMALQLIAKDPGQDAEQAKAELQQQAKRKFDSDTRKYAASITHDGRRPKLHEPTQAEIDRLVVEKSPSARFRDWVKRASAALSHGWDRLSDSARMHVYELLISANQQADNGAQINITPLIDLLNTLMTEPLRERTVNGGAGSNLVWDKKQQPGKAGAEAAITTPKRRGRKPADTQSLQTWITSRTFQMSGSGTKRALAQKIAEELKTLKPKGVRLVKWAAVERTLTGLEIEWSGSPLSRSAKVRAAVTAK